RRAGRDGRAEEHLSLLQNAPPPEIRPMRNCPVAPVVAGRGVSEDGTKESASSTTPAAARAPPATSVPLATPAALLPSLTACQPEGEQSRFGHSLAARLPSVTARTPKAVPTPRSTAPAPAAAIPAGRFHGVGGGGGGGGGSVDASGGTARKRDSVAMTVTLAS